VRLTAHQITAGNGFWYSKWGGREEAADRRTGTLVTLENKKLFTLYLESIGTSDQALDALADEVFGGSTRNRRRANQPLQWTGPAERSA
jgi:hypothetical protein